MKDGRVLISVRDDGIPVEAVTVRAEGRPDLDIGLNVYKPASGPIRGSFSATFYAKDYVPPGKELYVFYKGTNTILGGSNPQRIDVESHHGTDAEEPRQELGARGDRNPEGRATMEREHVQDMIALSEARTDAKFERLVGEMRESSARQDAKFDLLMREMATTSQRLSEMRDDVKNDGRSTRANLWAAVAVMAGVVVGIASIAVALAPAAFTAGTYLRDTVKAEVQSQATKPVSP
ncbi:hypothetical protein GU700_17195 [Methylobacterium sp. NI91]|nr:MULTISPECIES: hypothetical protein [unclassified Methylobacterium]QIJ76174.1 hypothetical protein CLZ_17190 [Methylobacterium sp. CLZ]QIJ81079.1 hypothetical protein GU700_17195 [Methylobacterium sp. NI91]